MNDIDIRNAESIRQTLKELVDRVLAQVSRVDGLVASMGTLSARMILLEKMVQAERAERAGHGPSVR